MACHHSSHHVHSHHQPCCCCCCCAPSCCQPSPPPGIPSATATAANDPLLQAIAAHLLQSPPAAPPPPYHLYNYNQQYLKPQHHHARQQQQQPQKYRHQVWQPELRQQPQAQSLIESLLGRIAALESALPHLSSPLPPPTAAPERPPRRKPPQPSPPVHPANPRLSMRDLAARTIQARFRQYLVRRSQALRHLKHLAAVRSHVAAITLSPSDQARLDEKALYQRATDLLLQLDSIQSTDPMIREGKRSISRELVRLLEFADGVSAKRHDLFTESMEIPHRGIDPLPFPEEPSPGFEEPAGVSTIYCEGDAGSSEMRIPPFKAGKRVTFAEDAEASRVSAASGMPLSSEEAMGRWDVVRASANGVDPEWGGSGGGGSRHTTDDERSPRSGQKPGTIRPVADGSPSAQKGSHLPGLSAPMPLQMEPRKGESKKKNAFLV